MDKTPCRDRSKKWQTNPAEATGESSHDTSCLEKALKTCNKHKGRVLFAGIADSKKCYEACARHNKKLLTPPNRRAILCHEPEYGLRAEIIQFSRL